MVVQNPKYQTKVPPIPGQEFQAIHVEHPSSMATNFLIHAMNAIGYVLLAGAFVKLTSDCVNRLSIEARESNIYFEYMWVTISLNFVTYLAFGCGCLLLSKLVAFVGRIEINTRIAAESHALNAGQNNGPTL